MSYQTKIGGTAVTEGALMNPNQALWEKGDFTQIAAFMGQSGEVIVESLGVAPPLRVLDLGCGDGTTAVPLARLGVEVVGIDIASNLVEAGNRRAAEAGLKRLKFQEETRAISKASRAIPLISFCPCSAPCSRRSPSTSPRRWSGSRSQAAAS